MNSIMARLFTLTMTMLFAGVTTLTASTTQLIVSEKNNKKLSVTTKMFIDEMNGSQSADSRNGSARSRSQANLDKAVGLVPASPTMNERLYASPDTIDGRVYISAFLLLRDNNDLDSLTALGVKVQRRFKKELITANVPVDKIDEVADIWNVTEIDVSPLMKPATKVSR